MGMSSGKQIRFDYKMARTDGSPLAEVGIQRGDSLMVFSGRGYAEAYLANFLSDSANRTRIVLISAVDDRIGRVHLSEPFVCRGFRLPGDYVRDDEGLGKKIPLKIGGVIFAADSERALAELLVRDNLFNRYGRFLIQHLSSDRNSPILAATLP